MSSNHKVNLEKIGSEMGKKLSTKHAVNGCSIRRIDIGDSAKDVNDQRKEALRQGINGIQMKGGGDAILWFCCRRMAY